MVFVLAIAAAACGGGGSTSGGGPTGQTSAPKNLPQGGTLKLALSSDVSAAFDPQKEYYSITWEYYRCCLLRTLMSYNGHTTQEGGTKALPDLAVAAPTVSQDGLTWT